MKSRLASLLAFVVAFGLVAGTLLQADQQTFGEGAYRPGPGVSNPVLLRQVQPKYTSNALRAKIQGVVELEVVVQPNGTVGDVRVLRSLDKSFGLDEEAITAARAWLFKPGMREGQPVPVIVVLELEFRIRSGPQDEFLKGTYRFDAPGVVAPKLQRQVEPKYTSEAMRAKIQGVVEVEAVVMPDGTVDRARVVKSLDKDLGLDAEAIKAVLQWTFTAGTLNGQPVPVVVQLTAGFRIH